MSLIGALDGATAGLSVASAQIAVVSRNIANQSNTSASRKIANVVTTNGLPIVASISRASNDALLTSLLSANAKQAKQSAISNALSQLQTTLGTGASDTSSPTALLGQFTNALQTYAASPQTTASGQAAVQAAQNFVSALNNDSATVQSVREQADAAMANSVTTINDVLSQFQKVNQTIVQGTQSGADVTDALDQRDSLLQQLSNQIGITTVTGANNGLSIYTDSGVTLFDQVPRSVTFNPTATFTASITGNAVSVDGVPVTDPQSTMQIQTGVLAGLAKVRDTLAVTYENQLDEIARGLITDFKETDKSGNNPQAGLFTNNGSLTIPTMAQSPGLASTIQVAASAIANPTLLRDGGISGSAYVSNPNPPSIGVAGDTGYSTRLTQLISNLSKPMAFDPSAGAGTQISLTDFTSASASWLGTQVSQASTAASYSAAVLSSTSTALSNATGVNLDLEMSNMIALEQAYQASAKLITAVSSLYTSLFAAIQ